MLVELSEMGILNHEEIEEMKKMEGDLLAVILSSKDSDVISKSAEVVTKHGYTYLGKALPGKLCSIANVLLHTNLFAIPYLML